MSGAACRSFAEIDAALDSTGFARVLRLFDRGEGPSEETPEEWFEGGNRWAAIGAIEVGDVRVTTVTVYEATGQYCDEWRRLPNRGWVHVEAGSFLDLRTHEVRPISDAERAAVGL